MPGTFSVVRANAFILALIGLACAHQAGFAADLRIGTGAAELAAEDTMVIAGGIGPGKASGQEGQLRAVTIALEQDTAKLAIVACDILMMTRQYLDPVVEQIERSIGIPANNILIHCTHTRHAPSTVLRRGYHPDELLRSSNAYHSVSHPA